MVYYIIAPRSQAGYQTPESKSMTLILTKFSQKLFKLQLNVLHVGTSWPMYILTISILNIEKMKHFSVCHLICSLSPILSTIPRHCQGQPRKLRKVQFCYIFPFFCALFNQHAHDITMASQQVPDLISKSMISPPPSSEASCCFGRFYCS